VNIEQEVWLCFVDFAKVEAMPAKFRQRDFGLRPQELGTKAKHCQGGHCVFVQVYFQEN